MRFYSTTKYIFAIIPVSSKWSNDLLPIHERCARFVLYLKVEWRFEWRKQPLKFWVEPSQVDRRFIQFFYVDSSQVSETNRLGCWLAFIQSTLYPAAIFVFWGDGKDIRPSNKLPQQQFQNVYFLLFWRLAEPGVTPLEWAGWTKIMCYVYICYVWLV